MRVSYSLLLAATLLTGAACSRVDVNTPTADPNNGLAHPFSTPAPTSANTVVPVPSDDMPLDTTRRPDWINTRIQKIQSTRQLNPPAQMYRYEYRGQTVYYETISGADQFSTLYDTTGKVLCHPDGGLTGKGDGNCPDFEKRRTGGVLVWTDQR
ncbi:hypothetical protein F1C16_16945 [Hymenobacter sp. NBH84]|uniref:DUF6970 domain-containing protein n=1 Tax=Hymenobacter defluvii TaxID=2054411 RepID=A0ABS3TAB2_9BACT|nr:MULTISPECIES: hypothetical protein [Hymenobacter]MBO3270278.1 hypothetical protein [Hymenobacter defluvii]QNE41132.1 hypothetical protein F1C16_16945 [Hymenobacter sp. NBH84]